MSRVVSFYEKLPRGSAPEVKAKGLIGRYQAAYFGKNASATRRFLTATKAAECAVLMLSSYHPRHYLHVGHRLLAKLLLPLA